jgi:hypothetical protein
MEIRNGYGTSGTRVAGEDEKSLNVETHVCMIEINISRTCASWRSVDVDNLHAQ